MIEVTNQHRRVAIDTNSISAFAADAIKQIADGRTFSISFISDEKMISLNSEFRGKASTTDVLSFPSELDEFDSDPAFMGDIIISIDQAQRQSVDNDLSIDLEIKQLILHGILHLLGYDHEKDNGEMVEMELSFRSRLSIT